MTTITIEKRVQGWTAVFRGSATMPNGAPLPLPFSGVVSAAIVRRSLCRLFPGAVLVTKGNSRDPELNPR